ncbi:MAG: hypothetical protein JW797_08535 [Bradymonadales bacterium]|nr:hypothetical protein [Bradymonadales bacterium]
MCENRRNPHKQDYIGPASDNALTGGLVVSGPSGSRLVHLFRRSKPKEAMARSPDSGPISTGKEGRAECPVDPSQAGGRGLAIGLAAALLLGLAIRLVFFAIQRGMHHPDEVFQYLEPATWRIHGYGWLSWEFVEGARNWILPGFYGALMEVGSWAGLKGYSLYRFLQLHNVLVSLVLIPAAFRIGRAVGGKDGLGGLFAAFAVALCPYLAFFAPHTLSESAGLILTTWAYALWLEEVARPRGTGGSLAALPVGLLLGAAVVVRYSLVVFVPLVLIDYLLRRRFRLLGWSVLGMACAAAVVGLVDWLTWGEPFHSAMEYYRFNVVERGAEIYGVLPRGYYLNDVLIGRLGVGAVLLGLGMALFFWRHWRLIAAWVLPLIALSLMKHKEERFLLSIWPFLLISGVNGYLAFIRWLAERPWKHSPKTSSSLALCQRDSMIAHGGQTGDRQEEESTRNSQRGAMVSDSDPKKDHEGGESSSYLDGDRSVWFSGWGLRIGTGLVGLVLVAVLAFNLHGTSRLELDSFADLFQAQAWVSRQADATGVLLDEPLNINGGFTLLGRNLPFWRLQFDLVDNPVFNYLVAQQPNIVRALRRRRAFTELRQIGSAIVFRRNTGGIELSRQPELLP